MLIILNSSLKAGDVQSGLLPIASSMSSGGRGDESRLACGTERKKDCTRFLDR